MIKSETEFGQSYIWMPKLAVLSDSNSNLNSAITIKNISKSVFSSHKDLDSDMDSNTSNQLIFNV